MIHFHMQRFKFIDFMVVELRFYKKKKKKKKIKMMMKTWTKCRNHFFRYYVYITSQHNKFLYTGYFSHILHLDIIKVFKLKVKMNKILIYCFQWG